LSEVFAHLRASSSCAPRAELNLVLVPGSSKSGRRRESLRRHAGYEANQIDLELPQRRLLEFARGETFQC
jgi:hypothetical protein